MQATSLPNHPSILAQMYPRQQIDNNFLNIPSIVTSPSIPTSASESFLFNFQQEPITSPISQAISAPVTPTNSVTPGFPSHPPRRKGNQNSNSNDGKANGSKSNSNLAHIPCKFFKSGACTAGKNCVFSHSKEPPTDNYVCKYFLKGNCKFGNRCALSHSLPNERNSKVNGRTSKNGSSVNGSRNGASNNLPEIRSPIMHPQYNQDDYQPLGSPGSPFTRIPISPSEYQNHRFSQLTASLSLNDQHPYSDPSQRLRNNYNNDHLTTPVNINGQQRRSLPDIFHLPQVNAADSFGTSPFQPAGSKSIFLPVSYVSDSGLLSPTINPHQQLHSIPEIHDYSLHNDSMVNDSMADDLCGYDYEEYIPSSLNELLTPIERERRKSKQEEASETSPRRLFSGSSSLHPLHIESQNIYNSHSDPSHVHFAARSLPYGVSMGLASNYMNQNDAQHLGPSYNSQHLFNLNSGQNMRNITINTNFEDWNDPISVRSPLSPMHNQFLSPTYERQYSTTPAINIPHPHEIHPSDPNSIYHRTPVGIIGSRPNVHDQTATSPPDPFSPFPVPDDDIFFSMDNVKNEQSQEMSSKAPETPKTPLSYSEATKVNLKDPGATPGLSIDSRRYEPLCPFGMAGNCRYGERCQYLHGLPCPSCLKHVLHPHLTPEEHQVHINECMNRHIQVVDGVRPEDIECGICFEKVLLKDDARFGLLNCEHAFCLQCIRQWRSSHNNNTTQVNQVVRSCPICRTPSHFITPSTTWITDHDEKQRIINEYKRKCSNIPCKHFNYGNGQCQFGSSCFYSHIYRDGTKGEINIRTIRNGEEVKILGDVRLWEFIENFADKRNSSVVGVTATIS